MICFYHNADLDGKCSAAIIRRAIPEVELYGINYGDDFPWDKLTLQTHVYMVDFSLQPFERMNQLRLACGELTWIDHHKSAIDEEKASGLRIKGIRDNNHAACELTWRYFFPDTPTPYAVELLGRYDVWDHSNQAVLPFQYGMRIAHNQPDATIWNQLLDGDNRIVMETIERGRTILMYITEQNKAACSSCAFETEFHGHRAIAINRPLSNSQTFDSIWDPEKYDMMIAFYLRNGTWTISMYTDRPDVDCGEIAKQNGGGGHKGAAGFQSKTIPFKTDG